MMIRYKFYRLLVKLKTFINRKNENYYNDIDIWLKFSVDIVLKLLKNKNSILLVSPISGDRYLQLYDNKDDTRNHPETFIVINKRQILIINHQYHYNFDMTEKMFKHLSNEFDIETERRRRKMRKEITNNLVNSLKDISKKIDMNNMNENK
jgi:competence CoiA-like predicted nuclease